MRLQTRHGLFETNSSSVHTIVISKHCDYGMHIPDSLEFNGAFFDHEVRSYQSPEDKANYLYTAICSFCTPEKRKEYMDKLQVILAKHGCEAEFMPYEDGINFLDWGHIDHSENIGPLIKTVFHDEKTLMTYLFGNAVIYTYDDAVDENKIRFMNDIKSCDGKDYHIIVKGN